MVILGAVVVIVVPRLRHTAEIGFRVFSTRLSVGSPMMMPMRMDRVAVKVVMLMAVSVRSTSMRMRCNTVEQPPARKKTEHSQKNAQIDLDPRFLHTRYSNKVSRLSQDNPGM